TPAPAPPAPPPPASPPPPAPPPPPPPPPAAPPAGPARLADLLLRWEDLRRQGQVRSARELCPDLPELHAELQQRIDWLFELDKLLHGTMAALHPQADDAPLEPPPLLTPPGYDFLKYLAHGAMGVVYQVRNQELK